MRVRRTWRRVARTIGCAISYEMGVSFRAMGWLPLTVLLGCGTVPLNPNEPPPAAASPIDASSVLLEDSVLETSVMIDVQSEVAALEAAMPRMLDHTGGGALAREEEMGNEGAPDDWEEIAPGVSLRSLVRREEIRSTLENSVLTFEADLRVGALARVAHASRFRRPEYRSCGCAGEVWCDEQETPPRTGRVRWTTTLEIGPDLHLVPTTTAEVLDLESCPLGRGKDAQPIDPMDRISREIEERASEAAKRLDAALRDSKGLSRAVDRLWAPLSEPVPFEKVRRLWLRPHAAILGEPEERDGKLAVPLQIVMRPAILPAGIERSKVQVPEARPGAFRERGLRVAVAMLVPLEEASAELREALVGRRFSKRKGRHLQITDAKVYGAEGGAVVQLEMAGSARGPLFLRGHLSLDPTTKIIALEDLSFDPPSQEALGQLYDVRELPNLEVVHAPWVEPEEILTAVQRHARWSIGESAQSLREQLTGALRRPLTHRTKLSVALDDAAFSNLVIDGEAIRLVMIFLGRAELRYREEVEVEPAEADGARIHPRLEGEREATQAQ